MVNHERVADNVYSFQSDIYAYVNAGVIAGPNWAVVVDTLAFPEESLAIRDFVEQQLNVPVRYVINTHYHADHSWGNCFFPGAMVLSSDLCKKYLADSGEESLNESRKHNPGVFKNVKIQLPHLTFSDGKIGLSVGKKTLSLIPLPGHSSDGIGVLIEEDRVLFTGDVFMPVPYIVDGDISQMVASLNVIRGLGLENVIQGHGDIVLRGEVDGAVQSNLDYLLMIAEIIEEASESRSPIDVLESYTVESCKKSRVLLGGLAEELHRNNLVNLFQKTVGKPPWADDEFEDPYPDGDGFFDD